MNRGTDVEVNEPTCSTHGEVGVVLGGNPDGLLHVQFQDGSHGFFEKGMLKRHYDPTEGMSADQVYELLVRVHTHLILQTGFWNTNSEGRPSPIRDADAFIVKRMSELRKEFELDCPSPDVSDITLPKGGTRRSAIINLK